MSINKKIKNKKSEGSSILEITGRVIGIIGGAIGILESIMAIMFGALLAANGENITAFLIGFLIMIFSIGGIIGSTTTKKRKKNGSWIMIGSATGATISILLFHTIAGINGITIFILPGPVMLTGGIIFLFRKEKTNPPTSSANRQ